MRCLNTKGKYGKVTNTEIKWLTISKSVMVIFVEFIDQLIVPALLEGPLFLIEKSALSIAMFIFCIHVLDCP